MPAKLALLALVLACGAASSAPETTPINTSAPRIEWRSFSQEVFEAARREGKLVLLDVGIEGCTACRWMLEGTYSDPEVARRVHADFISVTVDANANPELGARYIRWAWPATIVLTPDGEQLLAIRGNKRPRNFLPLLDEALRRAGSPEHEDAAAAEAMGTWECAELLRAASSREAPHGGWLRGNMLMTAGRLVDATLGIPERRDHALRTAEQYAELLDSEWGGLYMALRDGQPIYEKRMPQQAHGLLAFAHAYALTGDVTWLQHAASIDRYVERFLSDGSGGFYAAQRDVPTTGNQTAESYFAENDDERVAAGTPLVDRGIYSAVHAQGVEAYAELARLSGARNYAERALSAGQVLLAEVRDGRVAQLANTPHDEGRLRRQVDVPDYIVLETQARAGLALVALFDLTQDATFLQKAREIAERTRSELAATVGGFYSAPPVTMLPQERRALDNALFARLLFGLADRTHEHSFIEAAEDALRTALSLAGRRPHPGLLAQLLLADSARRGGIIDVSIAAGDMGSPAALALLEAAQSAYSHDRRAHFDRLERYPRRERAGAYVCTRSACSPPLFDAAAIRAAVQREADAAQCATAAAP
ncbi:MAG: DUF255 domain-containing protein [Polyangiales bacterium]